MMTDEYNMIVCMFVCFAAYD